MHMFYYKQSIILLAIILCVITISFSATLVTKNNDFFVLAKTSNISNSSLSTFQDNKSNMWLDSWNAGVVKEKIIDFVKNVTDPTSPDYILPEDRIAVFDNDGTMWSEKPIPFQAFFILDRIEELSRSYPDIRQDKVISQLLQKNLTNLQLGEKDVLSLALITHSNITQTNFNDIVEQWIRTAKHPQKQVRFVELVYEPMIELVNFLKDKQFKTFIVSGGGVDFMRKAPSQVYNIPYEQIIGSSVKYRYIDNAGSGNSTIFREPELNSFDNNEAKPENIQLHIGKVPVIAVGNSDGDLEMLTYTDDNNKDSKSFEIIIHHDDAIREYAYDSGAERILKKAEKRGWNVVSMENDFLNIFPMKNITDIN